jgi:DNA-binding GntR family transcriptional regulator
VSDASIQPSDAEPGRPFRPVRVGTLVEVIHDQLREAILDGSLASGAPIRESSVADQMGVSRAPIREALRLLEQSGLVVKRRNRSYEVTSFTDRDLYELATLRSALETLAARESMRHRAELERRLSEQLAAIASAVRRDDEASWLAADRRFHQCLVECSGNRRLSAAYSTLQDQIHLCLRTRHRERSALAHQIERHQRLLDEVVAGDVEGLTRALDLHIREGAGVERGMPDRADTRAAPDDTP